MLPEFGTKEFDKYLKGIAEGKIRHKYYKQSVEHAEDMAVHTEGATPEKLLKRKRPNESSEIREYRLESYEPVTKTYAEKVISVVNRIYNPRLFNINWKEDDQGLEQYLTDDMPQYDSLMKFITEIYTKKDFTDPNGVILIQPYNYLEVQLDDTNYYEPVPEIYTSDQVVDFDDGEYYTIQKHKDDICIVDRTHIRKFEVVERNRKEIKIELELEVEHGFGDPPAFRLGGVIIKTEKPQMHQSFISGVLPHWNKATQRASDLDGSIINTLYPEKWEFTVDCDVEDCNDGRITVDKITGYHVPEGAENSTLVECSRCHGTGKIATKSPFHVYQVNREALNPDSPLPTPPFGYADKETQSIELLDKFIDKDLEKGLFAINMDIVTKVGENQSGVAKTIDRQDLDSFLQQIANHVYGKIIPNCIYFMAMWRYGYKLNYKIDDILPEIEQPTRFDVLSVNNLLGELEGMKQSGLSPAITQGIQKDIIDKQFTSEEQKKKLKAVLNLDPLPGKTTDEIMAGISERVISREDYYIHEQITNLIDDLISENEGFLDLPYKDKRRLSIEKAKQRLSEMSIPLVPTNVA